MQPSNSLSNDTDNVETVDRGLRNGKISRARKNQSRHRHSRHSADFLGILSFLCCMSQMILLACCHDDRGCQCGTRTRSCYTLFGVEFDRALIARLKLVPSLSGSPRSACSMQQWRAGLCMIRVRSSGCRFAEAGAAARHVAKAGLVTLGSTHLQRQVPGLTWDLLSRIWLDSTVVAVNHKLCFSLAYKHGRARMS